MRADRLLSIVWLLRAHGRLSTAELGRRLEVSQRTILRDIEALSTAGVPVITERGPHGGVSLLPGYRTDVSALSSEEGRALFAAITTWGADSLGLSDALASGLRKLLAAVPGTHRDQSLEVASRIVIDPQGWLPQPERERTNETVRTVQDAVFTRRRLRIEYRRKSRTSTDTAVVDPQGLVSAGRSWYLCATRDGEVRFTKLSRIDRAEILPEACSNAGEIDVAAAWKTQREMFQGGFESLTVTAWVHESRWSDAQEWTIRATEIESDEKPPPGTGWSCLQLVFVDRLHAMTILLRLGPDAYVVGPKQLRQELISYLSQTLNLY